MKQITYQTWNEITFSCGSIFDVEYRARLLDRLCWNITLLCIWHFASLRGSCIIPKCFSTIQIQGPVFPLWVKIPPEGSKVSKPNLCQGTMSPWHMILGIEWSWHMTFHVWFTGPHGKYWGHISILDCKGMDMWYSILFHHFQLHSKWRCPRDWCGR